MTDFLHESSLPMPSDTNSAGSSLPHLAQSGLDGQNKSDSMFFSGFSFTFLLLKSEKGHKVGWVGIGKNLGKNWGIGKNMFKIYGMKFSKNMVWYEILKE